MVWKLILVKRHSDMKKGVVKEAERIALNQLDKWNDVSGFVQKHTGYYYEIQGVIEDAAFENSKVE